MNANDIIEYDARQGPPIVLIPTAEQKLRAILDKYGVPDPALVGKLPRVTCPDCSDKDKRCQQHSRKRCNECKAYVSTEHIHLDYLGHAETTRTLIEIDPLWSWEPVAWAENGAPAMVERGRKIEMWGRFTLLGVTRPCVGTVDKTQPELAKELIGDLIRNGAMRFGIALSLWSKQEWADIEHPEQSAPPAPVDERPWRDKFAAAFPHPTGITEADVCAKASKGKRRTVAEFDDLEVDTLRTAFTELLNEWSAKQQAAADGAGDDPPQPASPPEQEPSSDPPAAAPAQTRGRSK